MKHQYFALAIRFIMCLMSLTITYIGKSNADKTITVVGANDGTVQKIQYKKGDTYVDVVGTLFVLKDSTVTFRAVPQANKAFATGKPTWGGQAEGKSGQSVTVTFSTQSTSRTNTLQVSATPGTAPAVNVIVYDLVPTSQPTDNFAGRSQIKFGVAEIVNLSESILPTDVGLTDIGPVEWQRSGSAGKIAETNPTTGQGKFDAGISAGSCVVTLRLLDGPSIGYGKNLPAWSIVLPAARMTVDSTPPSKRHASGYWSVGYWGLMYLDPRDVSFKDLTHEEGSCNGVTPALTQGEGTNIQPITNWLKAAGFEGLTHISGSKGKASGGNITTGCKIINPNGSTDWWDKVFTGLYKPGGPKAQGFGVCPLFAGTRGEFTWPLPWTFKTPGGSKITTIIVPQHFTSDATGRATADKAGSSAEAAFAEADSTPPNWSDTTIY